jgi:hypothetical protein
MCETDGRLSLAMAYHSLFYFVYCLHNHVGQETKVNAFRDSFAKMVRSSVSESEVLDIPQSDEFGGERLVKRERGGSLRVGEGRASGRASISCLAGRKFDRSGFSPPKAFGGLKPFSLGARRSRSPKVLVEAAAL